MNNSQKIILGIAIVILGIAGVQQFQQQNLTADPRSLLNRLNQPPTLRDTPKQIVYEESVVTEVIEESLPSVVTIGISKTTAGSTFEINPFDPFDSFNRTPEGERTIEQNIGSGFIISADGLIITNKHVVSDTDATYQVLDNDQKKYNVEQIYRDPLNDLAILKINANNLKPLKLGDSSKLQLGQMAIAIGTPLGEFQNTVTTGIVSGIARGITAGSPFEGFVEKLDNVIQTDAAISPGNSGGPLLNSSGEAIGVNTAIASEGQNIGFAIPINVVKTLIQTFESNGGTFERPYIGVRYQMLDQRTAVLNDLVQGAYVESVVEDSPAAKAGIQADDIITEFDGKKIEGDDAESLTKLILDKNIGDRVGIKYWRNGEIQTAVLTLEGFSE
ncbi:MAG: S1C family serine protease [Weeksellaceae bacterium]